MNSFSKAAATEIYLDDLPIMVDALLAYLGLLILRYRFENSQVYALYSSSIIKDRLSLHALLFHLRIKIFFFIDKRAQS